MAEKSYYNHGMREEPAFYQHGQNQGQVPQTSFPAGQTSAYPAGQTSSYKMSQPTDYPMGQPTAYTAYPASYGQGTLITNPPDPTSSTAPDDDSTPKPYDDSDEAFGDSFSNKAVRRAFIKKVYLILFTQLLFTFGLVTLFIFVDSVKDWARSSVGLYVYLAAYILFIVIYIVLVCIKKVRRTSPANFICLAIFTMSFSFMAAMISSYHDTNIVLIAMGITALVCLSISLFAIQTKIDFTMCSGFLFVLCMVVFFFGWSCLITFYTWGESKILSSVYGALVALLFGLFLIYDTQMVVGGKKYALSPEEYIFGALQLYVDVVYLFLIILSFLGGNNSS